MANQLMVSVGQCSDKGRKQTNQDFHGVSIPKEPLLGSKGIAVALADGISSSTVSQIASQTAVSGFLSDYFCTSEALSVRRSAEQVLMATNSWLYSQTYQSQFRYDKDKGYVCTFSALVIKSTTAHIFHAGDARIYRLRANNLEQLTHDHRFWISQDKSYLSRALGINHQLEIDYHSADVEAGDIFILTTDGVYEHVSDFLMIDTIAAHAANLDEAAKALVSKAYEHGSEDNLTVQLVRVEQLPTPDAGEIYQQLTQLPFPPALEPRMAFDGYTINRQIHASSRSHVFLAVDNDSGTPVILKTPSVDLRDDAGYLERFLTEEWIARRINSAHVLKPCQQNRKRNYLYIVTEFIEGQTLTQWMIDNPAPDIETVRDIIEQAAKGLQAFHRLEMLHQDIKPDNIMIDSNGTVKIIDFGSTRVAGLMEITSPIERLDILGTAQYTAPEYFLGEPGTPASDLFALATITYQMLSGRLPYGADVAKSRTRAAQNKLIYRSVLSEDREVPAWIDFTLRKAVHHNPQRRYSELSEFIYDLRHPNREFLNKTRPPLLERNPVLFWQGVSLCLTLIIVFLLLR